MNVSGEGHPKPTHLVLEELHMGCLLLVIHVQDVGILSVVVRYWAHPPPGQLFLQTCDLALQFTYLGSHKSRHKTHKAYES